MRDSLGILGRYPSRSLALEIARGKGSHQASKRTVYQAQEVPGLWIGDISLVEHDQESDEFAWHSVPMHLIDVDEALDTHDNLVEGDEDNG